MQFDSIATLSGRAALALLLAAMLVAGGCAGGSKSARQAAAGDDPSAQCRAAVDDVSEFCGDIEVSAECEDAKDRSRDLCM